ncbi:PASTA domain-containing protein [Thiospirochaeta perfilievii]|uniref:PASTA domain-containing protein n=1 Tax=Thiospirochaeta perfilievii TaxID=252967 RepID=A0A5C1QH35_9SPIO|nr:PASTA domain-containing protein [Thiospirochaeta perfilievii]
MKFTIEGSGNVIKQSPQPGTEITPETVVTLEFK